MKRRTRLGLMLLVLLTAGPAAASASSRSGPDRPASAGVVVSGLAPAAITSGAAAPGNSKCRWRWQRRKVVKWVRRNGKRKRIVRYRKVRKRICVTVPAPAPARLGVKAWEFGFTLSAKEVAAGDTIIELNNRGEDAHDLHVQRLDGGTQYATPETGPGQINRVRLVTAPGSYRLWCSLPSHAIRGMDTTFEATGS